MHHYGNIMSGGDQVATDKPRFTISVDGEMLRHIEDFRYEGRYANRSTAIVELIKQGLIAIGKIEK